MPRCKLTIEYCGAGFVGSHIVDALLAEGAAEVIALDNLVRGNRENLAGALASVPLLRSVLVETSPYDPIAIGAACAVLLAVTLAASLAPAGRAARVEPITELRQE